MLDPWIIEEIIRREEESRRQQEQTRVELPLERPHYHESDTSKPTPSEDSERGVVVIDL